jgi:hypothetical protein
MTARKAIPYVYAFAQILSHSGSYALARDLTPKIQHPPMASGIFKPSAETRAGQRLALSSTSCPAPFVLLLALHN